MGVEDFSKFKKNRKKRSQLANKKWRESHYDPKPPIRPQNDQAVYLCFGRGDGFNSRV